MAPTTAQPVLACLAAPGARGSGGRLAAFTPLFYLAGGGSALPSVPPRRGAPALGGWAGTCTLPQGPKRRPR